MSTNIDIGPDPDVLAASAADLVIRAARESIAARGRFTLVLAGGSTPEKMYALLARPERAADIDWSRVYLFFGDERFVPADDPASNFGMVRRSLLAHVPISAEHVFPIATTAASAAEAAALYADKIAQFFARGANTAPPPRFDLIILGLGDDGHTASLFPGKPALDEEKSWVTWSPPGVLPPSVDRITLTFPVLNAARQTLFLVAGDKKAGILKEVLEDHPPRDKYPAAGVNLVDGVVTWLVDAAAAARLATKGK